MLVIYLPKLDKDLFLLSYMVHSVIHSVTVYVFTDPLYLYVSYLFTLVE